MRGLTWIAVTCALVGALVGAIRPSHSSRARDEGFDQPGAAAWHDLQRRLPAGGGGCRVCDLRQQIVKVANGPNYLFAFTHGRGAWRVRLQ